jgi:hypothetical protein
VGVAVVAVCRGLAMLGTPMPASRAGLSYSHSCRGPRAANSPTYGAVLEALSASLVRELDLAWVTDPGRVAIAAVGRPGDEAVIAPEWQAVELGSGPGPRRRSAWQPRLGSTDRLKAPSRWVFGSGPHHNHHRDHPSGSWPPGYPGWRVNALRSDGQVVPSWLAAALTLPSRSASAKAGSASARSARNRLGCQPGGPPHFLEGGRPLDVTVLLPSTFALRGC